MTKRALIKEWSDEKAMYHWLLCERTELGDVYDPIRRVGGNYYHVVCSGNKSWANRIAKHYKIDLTK